MTLRHSGNPLPIAVAAAKVSPAARAARQLLPLSSSFRWPLLMEPTFQL